MISVCSLFIVKETFAYLVILSPSRLRCACNGKATTRDKDMGKYEFGLPWIDQDKLYDTIEDAFARALGLQRANRPYPPDPFTVVAQTMVTNCTFERALSFDDERKANKTLSNAVGHMHQKILSLAENWTDMGTIGGGLDLMTKVGYIHPRFNAPVVVEVKNRFNTIRGENEKDVWDKIDAACKIIGGAQGYLFQITPKTPERYDREWTPSNRIAKKNVRVCDGATAYEIVFGEPHALKQLFMAMPRIFEVIKTENGLPVATDRIPTEEEMRRLYRTVFPD